MALTRIFRRTPSLRTRVAFATAVAATIVVGIVGTVVWVGITGDRKERLDRRLDEAAGFAIPFLPLGLDEIPPSPNDQDAVITVRRDNGQVSSNSRVVLPELEPGYADTYVDGVRYRVRTVELSAPEPMSVAVGATYDATIADTRNLHRRVLIICTLAVAAGSLGGWLLAAFAVRPFKRPAQQTRQIDTGAEPPDIDIRGSTEAVEIADALKGTLERIWEEQGRTKAALTSARDFASVSAHELRTPLTAMRTNLEVLATLDLAEEQRKEVVGDVIRTQSRIEATLGALERLAQGELSTADDHVPVDITELLDRAAHDAMRVYPDLEVSLRFTESPDAKLKNIHLSEQEWKVISYVRPTNSLRRISQAAGMNDTQIRKIAYGLLQAGIVELVGRPRAQDSQQRAARTYVKRGIVNKLIDRIKRL